MKYVVYDPADYADIEVKEAAPEPKKWTLAHRVKTLEAEILRLRAGNEKLNGQAAMNSRLLTENAELREENRLVGLQMDRMADEIEKLRAALKLFQPYSIPKNATDTDDLPVLIGDLRAAAAALKETGDE